MYKNFHVKNLKEMNFYKIHRCIRVDISEQSTGFYHLSSYTKFIILYSRSDINKHALREYKQFKFNMEIFAIENNQLHIFQI